MKRSWILRDPLVVDGGVGKATIPSEGRPVAGRPLPTIVEPPKEILEMEFSLANAPQMDGHSDSQPVIVEPVKVTKNVKSETSPGVKPKTEEKPKVTTETKGATESVVEEKPVKKSILDVLKDPKKPKTDGVVKTEQVPTNRDYSLFEPDEVEALKQSSNKAFEVALKLKKSSQQASDSQFYQSPDAYVTHPAYKELQTVAYYANKETKFWAEQLELIKLGKPAHELKEWNPQTGSPVLGSEITPNNTTEEMVRSNVYKINNIAEQKRSELAQFGNKYKQTIDADTGAINSERAKRFAWAANPELLEHTLDIPNIGERTVKQIREDFKSFFPTYMRSGPVMEICSDLFVALQMQGVQMAGMQDASSVAKTLATEEEKVEPGSTVKPKIQNKGFGNVIEFSTSGMPSIS